MGGFNSPEGDFDKIFVNRTELIDKYTGTTVWMCSSNGNGQLGDNTTVAKPAPVKIGPYDNYKVVDITAYNSAFIKSDGTLWMTGRNDAGQIGNSEGSAAHKSSPIQIAGTWNKISLSRFNLNGVAAGIKNDGTLWTWGYNNYACLGDNSVVNKSSPVQTTASGNDWKEVHCGITAVQAIKTDGSLWRWGYDASTLTTKSTPIQIGVSNNWKQIVTTSGVYLGLQKDGSLWNWGNGTRGNVGIGIESTNQPTPIKIGTDNDWRYISGDASYCMAIKNNGSLWAWGENNNGQLGIGNTTNKSSPTQVGVGYDWKYIYCIDNSVVGIKIDGTMWGWGSNTGGIIGFDDGYVSKSNPTQVGIDSTWSSLYLKVKS